MAVHSYLGAYASVGILLLIGVAFVTVAFSANRLLRPDDPRPEKLTTYECGVDPVGEGWAQTQVRYYVFAFLYVIFAVEAVFLFPWATVFSKRGFGTASLVEMLVFIAFLAVGLLYAWRKKVLEWV
ncbi:MAG: NADH-quinone oxidoreductase subunit A [Actinomycetota bacterium]|nr:NADH-quinone oxidoreductase subunit A [Actinomycetota bacterium]